MKGLKKTSKMWGKREELLLGVEQKASKLQRDSSPSVADSRDYMYNTDQSVIHADTKLHGLYLT